MPLFVVAFHFGYAGAKDFMSTSRNGYFVGWRFDVQKPLVACHASSSGRRGGSPLHLRKMGDSCWIAEGTVDQSTAPDQI